MPTNELTKFPPEVINRIDYYVYRLVDPRNGETFYVGKGQGDRVFDHVKDSLKRGPNKLNSTLKRIREIRESGAKVNYMIHRHGMDEKTALEVEAALIDAYDKASNKNAGHGSDERGSMSVEEVIWQYEAEEIPLDQHDLLMLSVNRSTDKNSTMDDIYEAVRFAWPVNKENAEGVDFVLAVRQGLVTGVFIAERWLEATERNFSGREDLPEKLGFIGREAPDDIKGLYLGKRLPDSMRKKGASNSVRYSYQ